MDYDNLSPEALGNLMIARMSLHSVQISTRALKLG